MGVRRQIILPDVLAPGLTLVLCGTAASRASAVARAYYAKPGNRFWPALAQVGITSRRLLPAEYPALLTMGVGLTDLAKHHFGNDAELPEDAFDLPSLVQKLEVFRPALIAFTSKSAGRAALGRVDAYGEQPGCIAGVPAWVLPSPSGLATKFWDAGPWLSLGRLVQRQRQIASGGIPPR